MEPINKKKSLILYQDAYPPLMRLSPSQRGWLMAVLMEYAAGVADSPDFPVEDTASYPNLETATQFVCAFMSGAIRRDTETWIRHRDRCRQAALNRESQRREASSAPAKPTPTKASYSRKAGGAPYAGDSDKGMADMAHYARQLRWEVQESENDGED
ncbi:MAG: DUF6291 domain-containing protein [Oscillibacter sp.]|nr:DUF6291 domain-containing protein [Oscillibacter sp.]